MVRKENVINPQGKKLRVVLIIQARMSSQRLPGKVLKKVLGRPLLWYMLQRLEFCNLVDEVVVATSVNSADDAIAHFCEEEEVPCFRGAEDDVLGRYYHCAKEFSADAVVRVTADCPLIDPDVVDQIVVAYRNAYPQIEYISNTRVRNFPRGFDTEVFSFEALEQAHREAIHSIAREHVTPFIRLQPGRFRVANYLSTYGDYSEYRLTVDEKDDFRLISKIIESLYATQPRFDLSNILDLFEEDPSLPRINAHVEQKEA